MHLGALGCILTSGLVTLSALGNTAPVRLAQPAGCKRGKGKSKLSSDSAEVRPQAKMWLSELFHTQLLCPHVWAGNTGKQGESEGVNSPVEGAT